MMAKTRKVLSSLVVCATLCSATYSTPAKAISTEERFQDLFVTAGYATAFGAALGAAFLSFADDPAAELRWVAVGASLGFIGGSILGSYVIFSPMIGFENSLDSQETMVAENEGSTPYSVLTKNRDAERENRGSINIKKINAPVLAIQPVIDTSSGRVSRIEGTLTLMTF